MHSHPPAPIAPARLDPHAPLRGVKILSLALNLPGPAALQRCRLLGATCVKLEPPAGDPMRTYSAAAYAALHEGIAVEAVDLKAQSGQERIHALLEATDVLLTSFRPSALAKLGLSWERLHARHPGLTQVAIVGAPGAGAEHPGHDLTYLAENGLVLGHALPATLYADMAGSLQACEAVVASRCGADTAGQFREVALVDAAAWLALPRQWGLTRPDGHVGGAHAGYRVYACRNGRVAVAALEHGFANRLCQVAGIAVPDMLSPETHRQVAAWMAGKLCVELEAIAVQSDLPLVVLPSDAAQP